MVRASGRSVVVLGADDGGSWGEVASALSNSGVIGTTGARLITDMTGRVGLRETSIGGLPASPLGVQEAGAGSALILG